MRKYLSIRCYFPGLIIILTTGLFFFSGVIFSQKDRKAEAEQMTASCIIKSFQKALDNLVDYQCVFDEYAVLDKQEETRVYKYFFKKPKLIRAEVIKGRNKGSIAFYRDGKARGKLRGLFSFVTISLKLTDFRITNLRRDTIDKSDWLYLLEETLFCQSRGQAKLLKIDYLEGRKAYCLGLGFNPHRGFVVQLSIDADTYLPLQLEEFTTDGKLVHIIKYKDIKINQNLSEKFFNP